MKKFLSVALATALIISPCTVNSLATDGKFSPCGGINEIFGSVVSVFAGLYNRVFKIDESNIEKAEAQEHSYEAADKSFKLEAYETEINAETWVMNELTYTSDKSYTDAFNDVTLDLILIGNGRKYIVPGFWNGGNTWKIRFVCPSAGDWYFSTECSDKTNLSLNNRTGKVVCSQYDGEYDIYKNGFVTTAYGEKYMTYDDGTAFLYLGDTHWSLGDETIDMVKTIAEKRQSQGFTVIQSEPIGAKFDVTNGVTQADISGFDEYDAKFKAIADNGLVHANAEFFFPSDMDSLLANFGGYGSNYTEAKIDGEKVKLYEISDTAKDYLEKLSRYWVARYGAFPVMWTLGQEVDNDFYWRSDNHSGWGYANNPYKLIAEYIAKYDCYDHPLSAHQENGSCTVAYGSGNGTTDVCKSFCNADASAFRDVKAHTWYAVQWSPTKDKQFDFDISKDYWYNSQGKPAINYEGAYCGLWTKDFGSRMQGWCSYLSGMYGYGWGGHDTWSYLNVYDEENTSSDGVDTITSQEKIDATWQDSLNYASSYQVGYMGEFFSQIEWYNLIPRFNNKAYFVPELNVKYAYAGNKDNSEIVIYFYSFSNADVAEKPNSGKLSGKATGTIGNLEKNQTYTYKWFSPITGKFTEECTFTSSIFGTHYIGKKADTDMVLYISKI